MCARRHFVQEVKESEALQVELFLNSVPLLQNLSREEKLMLVDALEEQVFPAGTRVITQASALPHSMRPKLLPFKKPLCKLFILSWAGMGWCQPSFCMVVMPCEMGACLAGP